MKKILTILFLYMMSLNISLAAQDIVGFWKSIDEKSGKAQSIVGIYEYQGKYFGRLIATYDQSGTKIEETMDNPKAHAPGVKGNPFYAGLDFIWDLEKNGSKYSDGEIMDPEEGKVYGAEVWTDKGNLVVRGEILFLGRNQTWPPAKDSDFPKDFKKPDMTTFIPKIPEVIER